MLLRLLTAIGLMGAAAVFMADEPASVQGCATLAPIDTSVKIADESAIIIWDAAAKTEHFIRRASFQTEARDFGFLVPTPTQPFLAEADDHAFDKLRIITEPETERRVTAGCLMGCGGHISDPAGTNVEVLASERVAGFDAAILQANDADALNKWLKEHRYQSSSAVKAWLKDYIDRGWKITAFKIAKEKDAEKSSRVATKALRMTFTTDKPFFPYREPADQQSADIWHPSRLLRVYFISDQLYQGTRGDGNNWSKTVWANAIPAATQTEVMGLLQLPVREDTAPRWLTEFEDRSSPRPSMDDVYFSPSADQKSIHRPPKMIYIDPTPLYLITGCFVSGYCFWRLRRRWLRQRS